MSVRNAARVFQETSQRSSFRRACPNRLTSLVWVKRGDSRIRMNKPGEMVLVLRDTRSLRQAHRRFFGTTQ